MKKVKITVIKKEYYAELAEKYLTDGREAGACPLLNVGDEFIFEGEAKMPAGFCPWAWIDVYASVSAISSGASYEPWYNKNGLEILCCSDGIRPVMFKVEALDV